MKQLGADIYASLDPLLKADVAVWCIALVLNDGSTLYLTTDNQPLEHDGHHWLPFPMDVGAIPDSGEGDLPTAQLSLTNVGRVPMLYLEAGVWDQALVVERAVIRDLARFEDAQGLIVEIPLRMQGAEATHETVTLALGQPNLLQRPYPVARYIRDEKYPGIPPNAN